jgi:hypothetical protein
MIPKSTKINDFEKFLEIAQNKNSDNWIFRGQNSYDDKLETTLERAVKDLEINLNELPRIEQGMIRNFKRRFSHYSNKIPEDDDYIEWLSIMQHYGCPTRLLDFTYSIYISLFFALNNVNIGGKIKIYCINSNWLNKEYEKSVATKPYHEEFRRDKKKTYKELHKIVLNTRKPFLYVINPFYLNERLSIQQGVFIIPTDITRPFKENYESTLKKSKHSKSIEIIEINCNKKFLYESKTFLYRANINDETLFPGIEGYSRNMRTKMIIPNALYADTENFI